MAPRALQKVPTGDALALARETALLTLALAERLQDNYAGHAAALGLTAAQAKVLLVLRRGEPVSQRTVADQLDYDPSNLTGLIDKLEALGALDRRPDDRDRRVKMLLLTAAGAKIQQAFWTALNSDPGPLAHLTEEQTRTLRDKLAEALPPAVLDGRGS